MKDDLGDRMKGYEAVTRHLLPRRTYTILRVDGKAFHTYTRGLDRPFDYDLMRDMDHVAGVLCKEISGSVFAYAQSDEISVLVTDFAKTTTQPWMGGVIAKWQSVGASLATAVLNERRPGKRALFDARVFTLPDAVEVANYFIWRQKDAVRNSISMAAQHYFGHKELQGKSSSEMQEMLYQKGVNWAHYTDGARRGRVVYKRFGMATVVWGGTEQIVERSEWVAAGAPHFKAEPGNWIAATIPSQAHLQEHSHS